MDIIKSYHPDRVLRCFARVQTIPPSPVALIRATRGATIAQYWIAYNYLDQIWERWHNHILSALQHSRPVLHPWDCIPNYMDWFVRMSHMIVQNLAHCSTYDPCVQDFQSTSSIVTQLAWLVRPIAFCMLSFNRNVTLIIHYYYFDFPCKQHRDCSKHHSTNPLERLWSERLRPRYAIRDAWAGKLLFGRCFSRWNTTSQTLQGNTDLQPKL